MDQSQNPTDETLALQDADALLSEYGDLLAEVKELKKRASELYNKVMKDHNDVEVAQTLEHILHIPE